MKMLDRANQWLLEHYPQWPFLPRRDREFVKWLAGAEQGGAEWPEIEAYVRDLGWDDERIARFKSNYLARA